MNSVFATTPKAVAEGKVRSIRLSNFPMHKIQEGNVVFPKMLSPAHMRENIDIFDFELTEDEMTEINSLPQKPYYAVPEDAPDFVLAVNDYDSQE